MHPMLRNQKNLPKVPFREVFRYATLWEKLLVFLGFISSAAMGIAMPLLNYLVGNSVNEYRTKDDLVHRMGIQFAQYAIAGGAIWVSVFGSRILFRHASVAIGNKLRKQYFKSLLKQDPGWYDQKNASAVASQVEAECYQVANGIDHRFGMCGFAFSSVISGFVLGFLRGWQLALISLIPAPFMAVPAFFGIRYMIRENVEKVMGYANAGAIVDQALTAIRTVVGLGGEAHEVQKYKDEINKLKPIIKESNLKSGIFMGIMQLMNFVAFGVICLVGSFFIENHTINPLFDEPYSSGDIISIMSTIGTVGMSIGFVFNAASGLMILKIYSAKAYAVIDNKPTINSENASGKEKPELQGEIKFHGVKFRYPSKKDKIIFEDLNICFEANKRTALVGSSGSGKSTIVQLIERLYDPEEGKVTINGVDVKNIDLAWLRNGIGYVGQEPVLFSGSIKENLAYAKEGATEAEMIEALKKANAYDFVMNFEHKLDTFVGTGGIQLSGGQKQRIAIARAILKNPKIYIFDEATSALDRKNEKEIQETLDQISQGVTTIVVAHRLTTVMNSDKIYVLEGGKIVEEGNHQQLTDLQGRYYNLQQSQIKIEDVVVDPKAESPVKLGMGGFPGMGGKGPFPGGFPGGKPPGMMGPGGPAMMGRPGPGGEMGRPGGMGAGPIGGMGPMGPMGPKGQVPAGPRPKASKVFKGIFQYAKQERKYFYTIIIVSIILGGAAPVRGYLQSRYTSTLFFPNDPNFRRDCNAYTIAILCIGLGVAISTVIQRYMFALVAHKLTTRIRTEVFSKFLRMHIAWHDLPKNTPGKLGTSLARDAESLSDIIATTSSNILQTITGVITAIIMCFIFNWRLTLSMFAVMPLWFLLTKTAATYRKKMFRENERTATAANIVIEAVNNHKTVYSLAAEKALHDKYAKSLDKIGKQAKKDNLPIGFFMGLSQSLTYVIVGLLQFLGAVYVKAADLEPSSVFTPFFVITYVLMAINQTLQFTPDIGKAIAAADTLLSYLKMKSDIDIEDSADKPEDPIMGEIEFRDVWFKYPNRDAYILKGISFKIPAGKKVAFAGSSGCGKSTTLSLLLRLYDIEKGQILIDGKDIKEYNLRHLRKKIGIVAQEPVLFNGSISYNIKYTRPSATDEEVREAARTANALQFIEETEKKFDTEAGAKGSQLSGGQKQRIAIARTIIQKPSIMLFDEATSALDAQSEAIVQDSLNKACEGVTAILVAHRISTIRDCDEILVFKDGEIIERGTFDDLVAAQGYFYSLKQGSL